MQHKLPGYFRLAVALWLHEEMTGYKTWRCRLLRWCVCRRSDKGATCCVDAWLPYDPRPNPINSLLGCLLNTEPKKCFISAPFSNSILLIYAGGGNNTITLNPSLHPTRQTEENTWKKFVLKTRLFLVHLAHLPIVVLSPLFCQPATCLSR